MVKQTIRWLNCPISTFDFLNVKVNRLHYQNHCGGKHKTHLGKNQETINPRVFKAWLSLCGKSR